ncbi:hypothetical protein K9M74_01650 [Candidatus Woesearchaeota archaeon]|nr:hypothetical protein [Candidatus Woesearchaeota archaeon]
MKTFTNDEIDALEDFLSQEIKERSYTYTLNKSFIDYKHIIFDAKEYLATELTEITARHAQARKIFSRKEAKYLHPDEKLAADNTFISWFELVQKNVWLCYRILDEIVAVKKGEDKNYKNKPLHILIPDNRVRNAMLRSIFQTKQIFNAYHDKKMQLKASIVRKTQQYTQAIDNIITDEDLTIAQRERIHSRLKISFPFNTITTQEFDKFSQYETEYLHTKANSIFGKDNNQKK